MIWTPGVVKAGCNQILRQAFQSKVPIYGNDTIEGYGRPGFFTELLSTPLTKTSLFLTRHTFAFIITYFEETHDEAHCYSVYNTICSAFNPAIKINGKRLVISNIGFEWIDEFADKMQITINFSAAAELGGNSDDNPLMEEVEVEIESEVY